MKAAFHVQHGSSGDLHAIVAHAVPMPVHTRVFNEAMDAKLAASLDEPKEGDTAKMLEKYRKEDRTQHRMLRPCSP